MISIPLNEGWQFAKGIASEFTSVLLPHDWLIRDVNNLYKSDIGWYKRNLDVSFLKEGERLFIHFDGVYMDSTLFVNNTAAGEWKYGYTAFEYDITDFLSEENTNTLLLKVNYEAPNARWYTGAGIYRDVCLKVKSSSHFKTDGIYITTTLNEDGWHYEVDAEVELGTQPYEVKHELLNTGTIIAWDTDHPHLYTLRSTLLVDGKATDTIDTNFGFRTLEFTTDKGFFLNGRPLKLNGVCLHHDLGALGTAVHKDALRRQLNLLKKMGVNAIRTAHNPPAHIFMDLADEMGFLIMSEILDIWKLPKNTYDYSRFFNEWIEKDVASWIRRDRNHPSLMMWSVGNEIYDTHADAEIGGDTLRHLMTLVKKHDPKGNAPTTLCSNYMPWENTQKCADLIKLIGYNYGEALYDHHHTIHPDWIIYGSETCSTVQSRGIYHFPLSKSILADDDLQCSALGNSSTSWGAKSAEACIIADRDTPYSLGQFIWAGQDYIGEPTPYHTKNSYLGHIDTAGFPKDSYYLFQAAWTNYKKNPMIHLFPYWDFSPGQMIDVRICSNAPKVELFLNGTSRGIRELNGKLIADWQLPYYPGTLHAVAYDEQGSAIADTCNPSFGDVNELILEDDVYDDLTFVTITAVDTDHHRVENANCRVFVQVEQGTLLALDNGDATDYEQYQTDSKRLFSGKLLAIVKSEKDRKPKITATFDLRDIPIRKIELTENECTITALILPENATYKDLYWRLTDASGIDSSLGKLEVSPDGMQAKLIKKGDGNVYIRCTAKNGKEHIPLISQIEYSITGMGKTFLDPYTFIAGGLYTKSNVTLTNGNERGVATLRNGDSHVIFEDLDFGNYGSNELTLPLFPLDKEPFTFDVWEGTPFEQGELIGTLSYDKGSVWNTYQEVTYTLPRRLKGVTTLCFVFHQKVHIKGFRFTKLEKAFQKLYAAESDSIYGDSYTLNSGAVEGISNNVSLIFEDMDFSHSGTKHLALSWRSRIEKNSILIVFSDEKSEFKQMIEVTKSEHYTHAVIPLNEKISGEKTVSLIFLPGADIDLEWLQFSQNY